jgi:hypothetical protein
MSLKEVRNSTRLFMNFTMLKIVLVEVIQNGVGWNLIELGSVIPL